MRRDWTSPEGRREVDTTVRDGWRDCVAIETRPTRTLGDPRMTMRRIASRLVHLTLIRERLRY